MLRRAVLTLLLLAVGHDRARANARLISVVPLDGGCVAAPSGPPNAVQQWDVVPGKTYRVTLTDVTECANGGKAATMNVRLNSSGVGNTDLVATLVTTGTYQFDFKIPAVAGCTMPISYCTTPGDNSSGIRVNGDDDEKQAHLRMSTFGAGCSNPIPITSACLTTPTHTISWGKVKAIYR